MATGLWGFAPDTQNRVSRFERGLAVEAMSSPELALPWGPTPGAVITAACILDWITARPSLTDAQAFAQDWLHGLDPRDDWQITDDEIRGWLDARKSGARRAWDRVTNSHAWTVAFERRAPRAA